MPQALTPAIPALMESLPNRKRWTRTDCDFLVRAGLLEDEYELLDGEIIIKVGQNQPHAITVSRTVFFLMGIFGPDRVQTQATIEVAAGDQATNSPEPDVTVLALPAFELNRTPSGNDLLLAVEVSDSTLRDDLRTKAVLYARAAIPEYWVIDIPSRRLIIHTDPTADGYGNILAYQENENIAPQVAPERSVRVIDLLAPLRPQG
jgi:Uma2 family endonuclease